MATINLEKVKELTHKHIDIIFAALDIEYDDQGTMYFACCPVHHESDNPNGFSYNLEKNMWRCWTHECQSEYGCNTFGLIRGVLSKKEGRDVPFGEALSWVCTVLNIDGVKMQNIASTPVISAFDELVNRYNEKKNHQIVDRDGFNWDKQVPSDYFVSRGFAPETLMEFDVGDNVDHTSTMRYRAVIPIHNEDGTIVVGSIGRGIKDYIEPKFFIEKGCNKRHYLYNYHRAKKRAKETSCLFIVEGQGDVWRLWESGVTNVVSLFGKEISEHQEHLIEKLGVTKLVILIDHDQAGRESKIKIQRAFGRFYKLIFPEIKTTRDIGSMSPDMVKEKILTNLKGLY